MAQTSTFTLPAQPAAGSGAFFTPFAGDGKSAPLGVYDVNFTLVGDASGGANNLQILMDPRYISMVGYIQASVTADTGAGDFELQLADTVTNVPTIRVVGTLPGVAETFTAVNSVFLWYPPPVWLSSTGRIQAKYPNVDATETYNLDCSIFVFDRNVRQLTAIQWLNMTRVGVNAVTAS